ncbi:hypothetical protein BDV23DRAFT_163269 [Aspergillus alliaceus]|uniref:Uncharacterized protein n=1 Tax=Petromyces alliaceus TaxID=209559 RepID=A0A5N7BX36_PETAA|nr:hypothetical protein BDV23DRAFT_163269 [Aspergillus alliaceus]
MPSKAMDNALEKAIEKDSLNAEQCLLPSHVAPRMSEGLLSWALTKSPPLTPRVLTLPDVDFDARMRH